MIEEGKLLQLKSWFEKYTKGFFSEDKHFNANIAMKIDHTKRVCIETLDIANSLNLPREKCFPAEIIALLHDIGRFEQYRRHGTYVDAQSEDHAALGVNIIHQYNLLKEIASPLSELIIRVVGRHNRASLPEKEDPDCLFFLKLLRDADKLDIWRVVTDYYHKSGVQSGAAIELGLPDTQEFSFEILNDLRNEKIPCLTKMKSLNDFKLIQMSWVYDINFPRAFQLIKKRKYLEQIYDTLPQMDKLAEAYQLVNSYLRRKCTTAGSSGAMLP